MNQEPFKVSHKVVKILEESMWEFVNDLRMEKVSLKETKNIDAKTEKWTRMPAQKLESLYDNRLITKSKDNQEIDQQREPSSYG